MYHLVFVCNALDDVTRLERGIETDSPAASRKIFLLSTALRNEKVSVRVLSMGRGKQDGTGRYFSAKVFRMGDIPVIYLPFIHFPVVSELFSMFSFIPVIWRLGRTKEKKTVIFYNRMPAYFLGLLLSRLLGFRTVLELEDGEITNRHCSVSAIKTAMLQRFFDSLCTGGALIACRSLGNTTPLRPVLACYGVMQSVPGEPDWNASVMSVLLGGTVSGDTGAPLLLEAIRQLRVSKPAWATNLQFEITGKGDCLEEFRQLACSKVSPAVVVHGRMKDDEYKSLLAKTQIGLALKPNLGALAHTTFPSKVIEFASQGILVVTTDISDVREVLADGALYLTEDEPMSLIEHLRWIVQNRHQAQELSAMGRQALSEVCSAEKVGPILAEFLFESKAEART